MDIKVITRHGPTNYGSVLQCIATLRTLRKLGHKGTIIDYQCSNERVPKRTLQEVNQKAGYNNNILKKILYLFCRWPEELIAQLSFDNMRKKHLCMTKRYSSVDELYTIKADVFMTGSDQVWRAVSNGKLDPAYFLTFAENTPKIAYSASFGRTEFSKEQEQCFKEWLSTYRALGIREDSGVELVKRLGIDNSVRVVDQVIDPTLLLSDEEWGAFGKNNIKGDYVLIYQVHNDNAVDNYAKSFALKVGMPVYKICPLLHKIKKGEKLIYLPDIEHFVGLIKGCRYLITDSFHGTCFALLFNKQFADILPIKGTATRNQSLLKLVGLENHIVNNYDDLSVPQQDINYSEVDSILQKERTRCIGLLKNMIENKL